MSATLAACQPAPPPPPPANVSFDGLPVTGTRAFAEQLGFTPCIDTGSALRCRRGGVTILGAGPYQGAVDVARRQAAGFSQLTLWHDTDQSALFAVVEALGIRGWQRCRTGSENQGDQEIWTKAGARVRFSMDLSYWGKRRLRVLPEAGQATGKCW
ncbi:hypothetical protein [Sphingomonas sp. Leaf33]|uniref:hypothetical protein n=1 Tax=Sphingomonas sp. Leaf33 TaxID=1736215 RepID=UPI000A5E1B8A|nr:hypothetical protein [Sphingomonas sp. Leaf33]